MYAQLSSALPRKKIRMVKKYCAKRPTYQRTVWVGFSWTDVLTVLQNLSVRQNYQHWHSQKSKLSQFDSVRKSKYGEGTLYWVEQKVKGSQKPLSWIHYCPVFTLFSGTSRGFWFAWLTWGSLIPIWGEPAVPFLSKCLKLKRELVPMMKRELDLLMSTTTWIFPIARNSQRKPNLVPSLVEIACNVSEDSNYSTTCCLDQDRTHHYLPSWSIPGSVPPSTIGSPAQHEDAEESDDSFDEDEMEEEQESVMKTIKFPEVEGGKIASSATKIAACLQKRTKALQPLYAKFEVKEGDPPLTELQQALLGWVNHSHYSWFCS